MVKWNSMIKRLLPSRLQPTRRHTIIASSVILVCSLSVGTYFLTRPKNNSLAPTFDIVLPQRRTVEDLGGWKRVSPAESDPVFAYSDTIDDVTISVSQQPIPASFAGNIAGNIKQLAESYSATTVIDAGGTQVYIGRSARGPQSVIFTKNNVLVLIKSQKTISQTEWIAYINNLVDPKTEQTPTF